VVLNAVIQPPPTGHYVVVKTPQKHTLQLIYSQLDIPGDFQDLDRNHQSHFDHDQCDQKHIEDNERSCHPIVWIKRSPKLDQAPARSWNLPGAPALRYFNYLDKIVEDSPENAVREDKLHPKLQSFVDAVELRGLPELGEVAQVEHQSQQVSLLERVEDHHEGQTDGGGEERQVLADVDASFCNKQEGVEAKKDKLDLPCKDLTMCTPIDNVIVRYSSTAKTARRR
jgi:hypothetical protein